MPKELIEKAKGLIHKIPKIEWVRDNYEIVLLIVGAILLLILLVLIIVLVVRIVKKHLKKKHTKKTKLVQEELEVQTEVFSEVPAGITTGYTQDIGARDNQQDNCCVCDGEKGTLAIVADGLGGLQNGAEVSGIITYVCREYYKQLNSVNYPEIELMQMIINANRNVCSYIESTGGKMSGSTLVAAFVKEDKLYFATVGDSRIYLVRNGKMLQLNREHIYGVELDEEVIREKIALNDALAHRERKSLTSYIGMGTLAHVDRNITPIQLCVGDKLLLASDGVFGTVSDEEMETAFAASTPQDASDMLIELVKEKHKPRQDNATAVVVYYQ